MSDVTSRSRARPRCTATEERRLEAAPICSLPEMSVVAAMIDRSGPSEMMSSTSTRPSPPSVVTLSVERAPVPVR